MLGFCFDVCRANVLSAPGLWHSNFDEGPLVRRVASTTLVKHSEDLFSFLLAEAEQELERINVVMNVKFLALWGLLCHLCQASASSTSGGRHGVGSIDFFILPST